MSDIFALWNTGATATTTYTRVHESTIRSGILGDFPSAQHSRTFTCKSAHSRNEGARRRRWPALIWITHPNLSGTGRGRRWVLAIAVSRDARGD